MSTLKKVKIGDIVLKVGNYDKGEIGIVLKRKSNSIGNKFIIVITSKGKITTWYQNLIKVVNE